MSSYLPKQANLFHLDSICFMIFCKAIKAFYIVRTIVFMLNKYHFTKGSKILFPNSFCQVLSCKLIHFLAPHIMNLIGCYKEITIHQNFK